MGLPVILAFLSAASSIASSNAQNEANDAILAAKEEAAKFRRASNTARSLQVANELKVKRANAMSDLKDTFLDIEGQVAIHRGEGITAGVSAGREVQTTLLKESKALADINQEAKAETAKVLQAGVDANSDVNAQLQVDRATHDANIISPELAFLNAITGGASAFVSAGGI